MRPDGSFPSLYRSYIKTHNPDTLAELQRCFPDEWKSADDEAICAELRDGDKSLIEEAKLRLRQFSSVDNKPWVLIGGPPCQAYSLVGRSRMAKLHDKLENDPRQTLYKCYLAFINELKPSIFVMENVQGLLSAKHKGNGVFERIVADMNEAGYEIRSLVKSNPAGPKDYIVEAERYGIPQARHRVILIGIKKGGANEISVLQESRAITLREALKGIPKIRSGFSERNKDWRTMNWCQYVNNAVDALLETDEGKALEPALRRVQQSRPPKLMVKQRIDGDKGRYDGWYRAHLNNHGLLTNHEARTHLASDLDRYLFCSAFAETNGYPAKLYDFPAYLIPKHRNAAGAKSGKEVDFPDRFRVQLYDRVSTTITSHISKDGHYYIHPDPEQCRSLTVREAARLQTFPDDYFFEGTRTSQYTQVGNAVPPLLAQQIGVIVADYLGIESQSFIGSLPATDLDLDCDAGDRGIHLF